LKKNPVSWKSTPFNETATAEGIFVSVDGGVLQMIFVVETNSPLIT
jgi:hypothetical protein